MTKDELARLREIAKRATPGPWVVDRPWLSRGLMHVDGVMPRANLHPDEMYQVVTTHNHGSKSAAKHVAVPEHGHSADDGSDAANNMEHIAAFCPKTALKLLDEIEAKDKLIEELRSELSEALANEQSSATAYAKARDVIAELTGALEGIVSKRGKTLLADCCVNKTCNNHFEDGNVVSVMLFLGVLISTACLLAIPCALPTQRKPSPKLRS